MNIQGLIPFYLYTTSQSEGSGVRKSCESLWWQVWESTFTELQVQKKMTADDFLDRELIGLRTPEGEICGFMLMKSFFLDEFMTRHSYFDNYPDHLKETLSLWHESVMAISYMTISETWRKSHTTLPLSEIIMGLCVLNFLNSPTEKLIGYFRKNRNTHDIFYRHGGVPLVKDHVAYKVDVDFAFVDRQTAHLSQNVESKVQTLNYWQLLTGEKSYDEIRRKLVL